MDFVDAVKICFVKYADFRGCAPRPAPGNRVATFLPSVAVGARRLHDIDRSGWWQLLYFFPIVGWIVLIIFWAEAGKQSRYA